MVEKKPIPEDLHEIRRDLLSDKHREYAIVNLGKNRGQYFIRLPTKISRLLGLEDRDKIKIIAEADDKTNEIKLEIIKGEKDVS